jgi:glycosyltransferase involved in cell wall biosynthesis
MACEFSQNAPAPAISVVIACVNRRECIFECLEHLEASPERDSMEILVMDRHCDDTPAAIHARFPNVTVHAGLVGASIPELRWKGIQAARGELVAVIEDHCMIATGWASQVLQLRHLPWGVMGGPVENGSRDRVLDWALFVAEYGACMPPLPRGETEWVPGNNAVYRRELLPLDEPEWASLWEYFLQRELRKRNVRMYLNPAMLVHHRKSFGFFESLKQRFLYSRSFAGMSARAMNGFERTVRGLATVMLPGLLALRIAGAVTRKRRNLADSVRGLPIIGLFLVSWGLGEMTGYFFGAGDSLAKVE